MNSLTPLEFSLVSTLCFAGVLMAAWALTVGAFAVWEKLKQ